MKKMYDNLVVMFDKNYTDDEVFICICYLYGLNKEDLETHRWLKELIKNAREMYEEDSQYD